MSNVGGSDLQSRHARSSRRSRFRGSGDLNSWLSFAPLNKSVQPVAPRRGTGEQIGFLAAARALRHQLAGIPEDGITVGDFVDREVTLKHAARRPEGRDTGFNVGAESRGHLFRRWRFGVPIEAQGSVALTESAELDEHVGPGSEGPDR